jgi:hypothetical protein
MNQRITKRLRRTLLQRTADVLFLVRQEYGENTVNLESPLGIWRLFKDLYKKGRVPNNLIVK